MGEIAGGGDIRTSGVELRAELHHPSVHRLLASFVDARVLGILIVERARRGVRVGLVRGVPQHGRELCLEAFLILAPRRVRRARGEAKVPPRPDAASPGGATPEPAAAASSCCLSAAPFACFLRLYSSSFFLPLSRSLALRSIASFAADGETVASADRRCRQRKRGAPRRTPLEIAPTGAIDAGSRGRFHSSACSRGMFRRVGPFERRASRCGRRASRLIRDQRSKNRASMIRKYFRKYSLLFANLFISLLENS